MTKNGIHRMFNPKTIAVIGASDKVGHVGNSIIQNLIDGKYPGHIIPVNPNHPTICGMVSAPSILSVTQPVDLVIVATPAITVPEIIEECGQKNVGGVAILTSGFKEIGGQGETFYNDISKLIHHYQMTVLGPNCLGLIRPPLSLNASFAKQNPLPGKIAFISQSGALCSAVLDWSREENVGFSHFISIGEMIDVGFSDLIDYLGDDPQTESILIYMESLSNARSFMSAARAYARTKPIVVLKAGKSLAGAKAALSHTGNLAGNDAVFDTAFRRAGILRVDTIRELFDCAESLSMQEKPSGNRLAIITNAGGPAVIATDALIAMGGNLAIFSEQTTTELNNKLPTNWSHGNPVDLLGDAGPDQYRNAVEICLKDEGVDGVLVILTPQAMTDSEKIAQEIIHLSKSYRKTILASWMGDGDVRSGKVILELGKVPDYDTPEDAVRSFLLMYRYKNNLDLLYETPSTIPHAFKPNTEKCKLLIEEISSTGRYILTENETKEILSYYDMPVPRSKVANSIMEAVSHAMEIGFPVAMKVLSPQVFHKTDIGGQRLNIRSSEEVKTAFEDIVMNVKKSVPNAEILGVLVEEMIPKKYELFIGCKKDPIFGPAIVFGMGGVAVELFNDTAVGLPPMNMALAMQMIERTKIYELLKGFRGMKSVDISAIQFLLYKFAYLVMDFPEIKDIDINPFGVDEKGGIVMDSKIILDDKVCGKPIRPYSHLCISPYPSKYIMPFTLNDNRAITLRPIRPEDEPIEREMFTHFSSETQRFRFFGPLKEVTHQMLTRYTQIDYDREIAIVGILEENGKKQMIGVGRIISDPYHDTAEFAVVVADPWQKLGLGSRLTDYLLEIAKEKKLKKVYAYALEDNTAIIHIFEKRAFQISKKDDGTYYAELNLIPQ